MSRQSIPDGIYTISNGKYPKVYANLVGGNANAALAGSENNTGSARQWLLHNLGGNVVTLQNLAASGNYATTTGETDGAPVYAGSTSKNWSLLTAGGSSYYITTVGDEYNWNLPTDTSDYTILLRPASTHTGPEAQWSFDKA